MLQIIRAVIDKLKALGHHETAEFGNAVHEFLKSAEARITSLEVRVKEFEDDFMHEYVQTEAIGHQIELSSAMKQALAEHGETNDGNPVASTQDEQAPKPTKGAPS